MRRWTTKQHTADSLPYCFYICALLQHKAIANSGFCDEVLGLRRIPLQFLPQMSHIDPQVVPALNMRWAPDVAQQLALSEHLTGVRQEVGQKTVFDGCQMHPLACPADN